MERTNNTDPHRLEAEDVRIEALEELLAGMRRFPDKLRLVRELLVKQLAPETDPTEMHGAAG